MKRLTINFSILAFAAFYFSGCKEPKPAVAPEPDMELQSALDASWATYAITDIDQMCGFMGENELLNHFYTYIPGTATANSGTVTVYRNPGPGAKYLRMAFNDTKCIDGRFRQGTVFMEYTFDPLRKVGANPNSEYYHEYGFSGQITLSNYRVDGWLVELYDGNFPAYVYNELVQNTWNPAVTNLVWQIAGKFKFTHPTDSLKQRSIVWEGKIFKTLTNTSNPAVYFENRLVPIDWSKAVVSYSGQVSGMTNGNVPFKMEIDANNPLVRDFTCYPDKIAGVALTSTANVLAQRYEEHHPFIKGIASFTTGDKYPRQIYYGNESNPDLEQQCDNVGIVMIKGIHYKVNFAK